MPEISASQDRRWELYRVLGEPLRLRVLALSDAEELAIFELADLLRESQPNVSRHVATLRDLGLLAMRRDGTRSFVRLHDGVRLDPVVRDALESGRALCRQDGSLARVISIVRARDHAGREYFAQPRQSPLLEGVREIGAYLMAVAPLLERRALAVDVGTGDGSLLDVLAPLYDKVVALDRSAAQLASAQERVRVRGFENVDLYQEEIDSKRIKKLLGAKADAVFASRVLHHAPKPRAYLEAMAAIAAPGGAILVLDYEPHDEESLREQADVWFGFEAAELKRLAKQAGLERPTVTHIAPSMRGRGPDRDVGWHVLVARKPPGLQRIAGRN